MGIGMAVGLWILAAIAFINGYGFWAGAKSAIHQILGAITFLISAVLLTGGCIIIGLQQSRDTNQIEQMGDSKQSQ